MFEVIETDQEWVIGLTSEIEEAAIEYEKNLLDDIGIEGIRESFLEDYIDTDKVEEYARELYEQIVYDDLDSYFDADVRELSRNQEIAIENKTNEISDKKDEITNLQEELSELENMDDENWNQDRIDEIESEISDLESEISDLEYEIDEIKEDPDGDIPDDLINEKIDDLVSDYVNNPLSFIREFGYEINDFIDIDELAKGIVDTDGVGVISSYDGNVDEETYLDTDYSIFRHN
jgi:DNA repair exonuclease SbcCD ATPase subunit